MPTNGECLSLALDGAQLFASSIDPDALRALQLGFGWPEGTPGRRRTIGASPLRPHFAAADALAAQLLGGVAYPVRALFFDKSPHRNWSLGWHQDRVIALHERRDLPGFGNWTVKAGIPHAEPPIALLENSLTLRLHLDPVTLDNAPLIVALGSHRRGRIASDQADCVAAALPNFACLALPGDIWAYRTLILHRSNAAIQPFRRRVIQILYASDRLPEGLRYWGI